MYGAFFPTPLLYLVSETAALSHHLEGLDDVAIDPVIEFINADAALIASIDPADVFFIRFRSQGCSHI